MSFNFYFKVNYHKDMFLIYLPGSSQQNLWFHHRLNHALQRNLILLEEGYLILRPSLWHQEPKTFVWLNNLCWILDKQIKIKFHVNSMIGKLWFTFLWPAAGLRLTNSNFFACKVSRLIFTASNPASTTQ